MIIPKNVLQFSEYAENSSKVHSWISLPTDAVFYLDDVASREKLTRGELVSLIALSSQEKSDTSCNIYRFLMVYYHTLKSQLIDEAKVTHSHSRFFDNDNAALFISFESGPSVYIPIYVNDRASAKRRWRSQPQILSN